MLKIRSLCVFCGSRKGSNPAYELAARELGKLMGERGVNPHTTFLRDRMIGKTYKFGYHWHQYSDILLRNLKDKFSSTNFIGIRVLGKRDASQFMRMHNAGEKVHSDW